MDSELFPLRLKPFEEFFFYDDDVDHPSTMFCLVTFASRLDPTIVEKAFHAAVQRQPLMQCRVVLDSKQQPWFQPVDCVERLQVFDASWQDMIFDTLVVDPTSESPIKLSFFEAGPQTQLLFQSHHCALDAIGAYQFFRDWLASYGQMTGTSVKKLPNLDPSDLKQRCQIHLPFFKRLRLLPGQWHSLKGVFKFRQRQVISFLPIETRTDEQKNFLRWFTVALSAELTQTLRDFAQTLGVTVNTLLLRDLFLAVRNWQTLQFNQIPVGTHWRIAVPINERTVGHRRMPACNHCSTIFLDRNEMELEDPAELLSGIHEQMHCIRKWKLSLNMWRYLSLMRLFGGIERRVRTKSEQRSYSTIVLSNVGDLSLSRTKRRDKVPEVIRFEPVGPLRTGTPVSITTFYFKKQLNLTFRYDPRAVSAGAIQTFSQMFLRTIESNIVES